MPQGDFGDLIVVIPGILGSRLVRRKGNRLVTVWDFSIRSLPALLGALLGNHLALEGNGIDPPDDGIEAADLFSYQLLPGYFGVDDYASLLDSIRRSVGERQMLTFPYDWRLSNRHAAKRLESVALDALKRWREESGKADAKLWLVCHSMGGLVARYFCESLGGAADTRAIIYMGTPHRGSVRALDALVNGKSFGRIDLTPTVRSLPSAYELLPLFPVVREGARDATAMHRVAEMFGLDPVTGEDRPTWIAPEPQGRPPPLPGIDRTMLKRALQFHAAIRVPAEARAHRGEPCPYRQEVFFNRRQPTPLSAWLEGGKLELLNTSPEERQGGWSEEDARGDGTVPSFASVPIEWENSANALPVAEKHAAMQAADALHDNLFNWLRPLDVRGRRGAGVDDGRIIALDVPTTCVEGDDLVVKTASLRPANGFVDVVHVDSGSKSTKPIALRGGDAPRLSEFSQLLPGVHRVIVRTADQMVPPVSDYVFVTER
jgi:pimeloyl-ACP methyl ester carboxylesterase